MEGRTQLLVRLADALDDRKEFFGENGRPGNMLGKPCDVSPYNGII